jgi:methyl-accepting chemotaxis protein
MNEPDPSGRGGVFGRLVPAVIRRRYAAKFVVSILIVALIIGATGAISYVQASTTTEQQVDRQLQSSAELYLLTLADWRSAMRSQADTFVRSDQFVENQVTSAALEGARRDAHATAAIYHIDTEERRVLESTDEEIASTGFEEIDEPWVDHVDEDSGSWVSPRAYYSEEADSYVLAFGSQVDGVDGNDRYVVMVSSIEDRVSSVDAAFDGQRTVIRDESGTPVFAFDEKGRIEVDEGTTDGYVTAEASGEVAGGERTWTVTTGTAEGEAYEVSETLGRTMLIGLVVGLSALGLVGFVLGRQTVPPLLELRSQANAMEAGDLDVELATDREDEIGQLYRGFASMRDALREQIQEVLEARREAEAARERTEELNEHLERKAEEYSSVMRAAGGGDLTVRMDPDSESEAMAAIAAESNEMLAELERTVEQVTTFADDVASASEEVTASAEEVRSASKEVSVSIQQISDGATHQNESLKTTNDEMETLSKTIQGIAATSDDVADIAERTAMTGREGQQAARTAIEGMDRIREESVSALEAIESLDAEMEQIDELLEFISDVAEQTNMLALNANIEASRSGGESGEGFSVVAEEVKELSEETKEAAETIETRIEQLKERTDTAVEEVRETTTEVAEQTENVERAAQALEHIGEYAEKTNTGVQKISDATEQQAASTQQVVAMVDRAVSISEDTTREAETVAGAAEEQTTALTEVTQSASSLSEQASHLSNALDRFETDVTQHGESWDRETRDTDLADPKSRQRGDD